MALIHVAAMVFALCFFLAAECSLGAFLLSRLKISIESFTEYVLIAVAAGMVTSEIALSFIDWTRHIRMGCVFLLALLAVPLAGHVRTVSTLGLNYFRKTTPLSKLETLLCGSIGLVILIEFVASLAPLTGSDALNYHFTSQKLILENGFHPDFSLLHSFLCGQNHLLILLGLALGNERLAMALIFLGGPLSALCVFCLARRWVSREIALLFALLFLVTPIAFWQVSTSGSPDIWMAVFTGAAVLVVATQSLYHSWRHAVLAGLLAGGIAGAKYTGCAIAAMLALAFLMESRSIKRTALLFTSALFAGIWPYLRNLIWTGDPVFPFLTSRLYPQHTNLFALASLRADTGAAMGHSWGSMLPFVVFAEQQGREAPLFWQFYGPITLALMPLTLVAVRNTRNWRVLLLAWLGAGLAIYATSGLVRFLLPVFPVALACTAAGMAQAHNKNWLGTYRLAWTSAALLALLGIGGLLIYTMPAISAASGLVSRQAYLESRAPDYKIAETVNRALEDVPRTGKVLVFFRHLYYLNVEFVYGNPAGSWIMDPHLLRTPADFQEFFQRDGISYVVRSPEYPEEWRKPLQELEKEGGLVPFSVASVDNFVGDRIAGRREEMRVEIFRVTRQDQHATPASRP